MAFLYNQKISLRNRVEYMFDRYCQVIHPPIVEPTEIYRCAYTDAEWDALHILKKMGDGVLSRGYSFDCFVRSAHGNFAMTYTNVEHLPHRHVKWEQLPVELHARLLPWAEEAHRHAGLYKRLHNALSTLLFDTRNICSTPGICNTPGTLCAVWPELSFFLEGGDKIERAGRKIKLRLPKAVDRNWVDAFHRGEGMQELSDILLAISLVGADTLISNPAYPRVG